MNDSTEACFECGGTARAVEAPRRVKVGRRSVRIVDAFMQCDACGEEYYLPGQMEESQRRASEALTAGSSALTPDDVRAAREALGLTQVELERLLGVGPKTVVRWERGTVRPNAATDRLLRLVRDVPGAAEHLAGQADVALRRVVAPSAAPQTVSMALRSPASGTHGAVVFAAAPVVRSAVTLALREDLFASSNGDGATVV